MSTVVVGRSALARAFLGHLAATVGLSFRLRSTGTAEPLNSRTAGAFAGLQRALNAYLAKFTLAPAEEALLLSAAPSRRLAVDGLIGERTRRAATAVLTNVATRTGRTVEIPSTISRLAEQSSVLAVTIAAVAGKAPDVSAPAPRTSTTVSGGEDAIGLPAPPKRAGFPLVPVLALGAVIGGAVYFKRARRRR